MASLQFPPTGGLLTPSSSRGSTTVPRRSSSPHASSQPPPPAATPKLRDSCHACASSKVKCHKEKPACSRCTKRGLTCEYVATKRVGRKHDSRLSISETATAASKNNSNSHSHNQGRGTTSSLNINSHVNGTGNNSTANTPPSSATSSINVASQLPALNNWFATSSDFLPTLASVHPSPGPGPTVSASGGVASTSNLFPSALSPGVDQTFSVFTSLSSDLDDFFASPVSFSGHDASGPNGGDSDLLSGQPDFYAGVDAAGATGFETFSMFEKSMITTDLPAATHTLGSPPNSRASPSPVMTSAPPSALMSSSMDCDDQLQQTLQAGFGTGAGGSTGLDSSHCCCLVRALGLMKQLFPEPSPSGCFSLQAASAVHDNGSSNSNGGGLPTIQTVISKNEHTIKAVSNMLQCACSQDGYLLAIMSLIVFKVLGWYAAAARQTPVISSSNIGNDAMDILYDGSISATSSNSSSGRQSPLLRSAHHSHTNLAQLQLHHHRQSSTASSSIISAATMSRSGRPPSLHAGAEQVRAMHGPAVVGSYTLDGGEDSARMAGQLVLSELHRVQRLVSELSMRLKTHAAGLASAAAAAAATSSSSAAATALPGNVAGGEAFSAGAHAHAHAAGNVPSSSALSQCQGQGPASAAASQTQAQASATASPSPLHIDEHHAATSSSSTAASAAAAAAAAAALAPPSPFSAVMLDQLAADLRKRLRALSLEIVEGLRRD